MNEEQWLAATDPTPMLEALRATGKASERKYRLFSCACLRRVWFHLSDERAREAVSVAERFADDSALVDQVAAANKAAWPGMDFEAPATMAALLASAGVRIHPALAAWGAARAAAGSVAESRIARLTASDEAYAAWDIALAWADGDDGQEANWRSLTTARDSCDEDPAQSREKEAQAALLRCIFSDPFRPPTPLPPSLLPWRDGLLQRLTEAAYEHRILPSGHLDPDRVAVLADAIEESGFTDAELLGHLRGPGPHVRGCWAVDAITGRE
jgi:hypothetical protein